MKTLSICIPTYNRSKQLEELVRSLLQVQSDDFEVVVTDNCSTDNTLEALNSIKDERLMVYTNQKPEPAYYNIILSIFNAKGKYALHCNDRDVIFSERLLSFIEFLRNHDYSYLHIAKCFGNPSYNLTEYEKGFDSLIHHSFCQHPTGMVFNVELIKENLQKDNYLKYVQDVYTWCFLCRDLLIYEKSAEYDNYLWDERPSIFKVQSASGAKYKGQLFFETEKIVDYMKGTVAHTIGNPYFSLSTNQQKQLILKILVDFMYAVMWKKSYYADTRECAHYGIKPRFVSYFEMKGAYARYFEECDKILKNTDLYEELKGVWNKQKKSFLIRLPKYCLGTDYTILKRKFKRFFCPNFRY